MKVLLIPQRKTVWQHFFKSLDFEQFIPYYLPSNQGFFNVNDKCNWKPVASILLKNQTKEDIESYFHTLPDDLFFHLEKTNLLAYVDENKGRVKVKPFQYHFHKNGINIWTVENYYQYPQGKPLNTFSDLPKIKNPEHIDFFYHYDTMSVYGNQNKYVHILDRNKGEWRSISCQYDYVYIHKNNNNNLLISVNKNSCCICEKAIIQNDKMVYLSKYNQTVWDIGSKQIFSSAPYNNNSCQKNKEAFLSCFLDKIVLYQNHYFLLGNINFNVSKGKEVVFKTYIMLPDKFNRSNPIPDFNNLWENHIVPQNKEAIAKLIQEVDSQNPSVLKNFIIYIIYLHLGIIFLPPLLLFRLCDKYIFSKSQKETIDFIQKLISKFKMESISGRDKKLQAVPPLGFFEYSFKESNKES